MATMRDLHLSGIRFAAIALLLVLCCSPPCARSDGTALKRRVSVLPGAHHIQVPTSFLGLSHEPLTMAKHVVRTPSYQAFIRLLSGFQTGPFVVRWGGNEQDKLTEVMEDEQWESMHDLHANTGAVFMIGLNLRAKDPALAVRQVTSAMRILPPAAVMAFNIGNEPDSFTMRAGNKTLFPNNYWSDGYFTDFKAYCLALEPLLLKHFKTPKMASGPGCADMMRWKDTQFKRFIREDPLRQYASMLTAHFYTHRSTSPGTSHETFLDEAKMEWLRLHLRPWVRWATSRRLPFRLEETNTLSIQVAEAQDMLRKKNLRQSARACDRLAGRSRSHQIPPAMRDVSGALHSGPDGVLKAMTESFDKLYGGETKLSDETLNQLENDVAAFELTRATEVDEAHGRPPDLAETEACVRALRSAAAPGG
ncbi:hypothetical protein FOA52_005969 [Chlamydomonas sp. UWO 241]|nr:hypothetical protein FOA52_005969 [Chlamydomonas sp. UWO 241]